MFGKGQQFYSILHFARRGELCSPAGDRRSPLRYRGVVGARIARPPLCRLLHRHLCRVQHILNENAVAARGVIDENVGDSARELAVLQCLGERLINDVGFSVVNSTYTGAADRFPIGGSNEAHRVADDRLNLRNGKGRIGLVSGLKIKDLTVAPFIQNARTEHLSSGIATDQQDLVRIGNYEGLSIGFLML